MNLRIFPHAMMFLFFAQLLVVLPSAQAAESSEAGVPLRVGGSYLVKRIDQLAEGSFRVVFESMEESGKFDRLTLETDHVNFAVRKGSLVRLSAEILSVKGATAEVSQVVIFMPTKQGPTPVWMLSKKDHSGELRGSRYLEMHAPSNDYQVF